MDEVETNCLPHSILLPPELDADNKNKLINISIHNFIRCEVPETTLWFRLSGTVEWPPVRPLSGLISAIKIKNKNKKGTTVKNLKCYLDVIRWYTTMPPLGKYLAVYTQQSAQLIKTSQFLFFPTTRALYLWPVFTSGYYGTAGAGNNKTNIAVLCVLSALCVSLSSCIHYTLRCSSCPVPEPDVTVSCSTLA